MKFAVESSTNRKPIVEMKSAEAKFRLEPVTKKTSASLSSNRILWSMNTELSSKDRFGDLREKDFPVDGSYTFWNLGTLVCHGFLLSESLVDSDWTIETESLAILLEARILIANLDESGWTNLAKSFSESFLKPFLNLSHFQNRAKHGRVSFLVQVWQTTASDKDSIREHFFCMNPNPPSMRSKYGP